MFGRDDLRRYQNLCVAKIRQSFTPGPNKLPGVMLALEPGAGKTVIVLTALDDAIKAGEIGKTLIVAPLLVAQTVWPEEPAEWSHLQHLEPLLLRVPDSDPDAAAAGRTAYQEALTRFRAINRAAVFFGVPPEHFDRLMSFVGMSAAQRAERERAAAIAEVRERKLEALVEDPNPIHVVNKEALPWLWDYAKRRKGWPYDVMVVDDCRESRTASVRVKKPKGEQAPLSRWGVMVMARKYMKSLIQLSGTPTPKGLHNVWGLIHPIDLGARLGQHKTPFYKKFFYMNEFHQPRDPKAGAFEAIMSKVKDIMFSLDPDDMAELPEYIPVPIKVKLEPEVLKEYRRFKRDLVSEQYDVEALNGGALHLKLFQYACGSLYNFDGKDVWVHDAKLEALRELVEQLDGTPLLVAYDFEFDKQRILKTFKDAVLLTPDNSTQFKRDWNADKIRIGLCHRASAGHGLSLHKGTGHMCEYGLTSDAELYQQFLRRIRRPGRKTTVYNHIIIAEGTIDEEVFPMYLDPKIETQDQVMSYVRLDTSEDPLESLLG